VPNYLDENALYIEVLTHVGETDWRSMGIAPPEDCVEQMVVPFKNIMYIVTENNYTKIKLNDGTVWLSTIDVDTAFTGLVAYLKRNPL
jgi:hypothetical protein